jgi:hypothetical protein
LQGPQIDPSPATQRQIRMPQAVKVGIQRAGGPFDGVGDASGFEIAPQWEELH